MLATSKQEKVQMKRLTVNLIFAFNFGLYIPSEIRRLLLRPRRRRNNTTDIQSAEAILRNTPDMNQGGLLNIESIGYSYTLHGCSVNVCWFNPFSLLFPIESGRR